MSDAVSDLDTSITQTYERAAAATDVQRRLAGVHGTGAAHGVSAVVSGTGELVDLRIADEALRLGPARLGEAIVAAAAQASEDASRRGLSLVALALGDEATAEVERPDRGSPATPAAAALGTTDDEDDVFTFDASIFRSDR